MDALRGACKKRPRGACLVKAATSSKTVRSVAQAFPQRYVEFPASRCLARRSRLIADIDRAGAIHTDTPIRTCTYGTDRKDTMPAARLQYAARLRYVRGRSNVDRNRPEPGQHDAVAQRWCSQGSGLCHAGHRVM